MFLNYLCGFKKQFQNFCLFFLYLEICRSSHVSFLSCYYYTLTESYRERLRCFWHHMPRFPSYSNILTIITIMYDDVEITSLLRIKHAIRAASLISWRAASTTRVSRFRFCDEGDSDYCFCSLLQEKSGSNSYSSNKNASRADHSPVFGK